MLSFENYIESITSALKNMKITDKSGQELNHEKGMLELCEAARRIKAVQGTLYFAGNGASAMMASHMATDFCKNGGIRSLTFNDVSLMTATGNDISYEDCFGMPLKWYSSPGDGLVTISSSGNSPNIIRAIEVANELGLLVITLSGMSPDNRLRKLGNLNFYVPADTYGFVESSHQILLHYWFDRFMEENNL